MHLKMDYQADSSLSDWGIKHNNERITVFVTTKKLANLHSKQFAGDLQGFRTQGATRNKGVVESNVAAEFAPQAAFVFLFNIPQRNDITVASTSIALLVPCHLLNIQGET